MEKIKYLISQVNPDMITIFLKAIRKNKVYEKQDIEDLLKNKGRLTPSFSKYITEISVTLSQFGILDINSSDGTFNLSEFGSKMKKILLKSRGLFFEIYHLLSYYIFDLNKQDLSILPFRSYQILCNFIYESNHVLNNKQIADYVDSQIKDTYRVQGAFSETCITRGIAWLKMLEPPVIDEKKNRVLRKPIHNEIVLLSIDYYYRVYNVQYNTPLFIDYKIRELLSKPIIINPDYINDILRELSQVVPHYLTIKYNVAGTYIILKNKVNISDLF